MDHDLGPLIHTCSDLSPNQVHSGSSEGREAFSLSHQASTPLYWPSDLRPSESHFWFASENQKYQVSVGHSEAQRDQ